MGDFAADGVDSAHFGSLFVCSMLMIRGKSPGFGCAGVFGVARVGYLREQDLRLLLATGDIPAH